MYMGAIQLDYRLKVLLWNTWNVLNKDVYKEEKQDALCTSRVGMIKLSFAPNAQNQVKVLWI